MKIETTPLKDVLILTPNIFKDERGYFFESYNTQKVADFIKCEFVQDNESLSQKNVLRGLHFQIPPFAQDKLVRVIKGSVLDIAVDLRKSSPTYGQSYSIILSGENKKQLFIPAGFAHGFITLEDDTLFSYKCSNYYEKNAERTILWNDKSLNIEWNCDQPLLSDKDLIGENFSTFESPFN
ncbi:MAG TPA: dTDP-4-dehydrorhamnose 3,5-epimerase [Flavobacteriaceae bacterium]|nr:dTDP-4-dehydrorhamnose 3,5-epimerase [Flavobacteriaceae bacterium]